LWRALSSQVERRAGALATRSARLQAVDPRRVLARGYAWIEDARGQPQLGAKGLKAGEALRAVWQDGSAQALVQSVELLEDGPDPGKE
jgi:exodeoxyribonuclease VII large subunit